MKLSVEFKTFKGYKVNFNLDTDDLDRNYDDEDYAYWIKDAKNDGNLMVFEIDIQKEFGTTDVFIPKATIFVYNTLGDFEDDYCSEIIYADFK